MFGSRSIFASPTARALLCANQLQSFDQIRRNCAVNTPRKHRAVCAVDLHADHQDQIRVYVKQQWDWDRFFPRPGDVWRGHAFRPWPLREWHGLSSLRAVGLLAAEPLAVFYKGLPSPCSAIVIKAVPAESSLFELLASGGLNRLAPDQQHALAGAVAGVLQRIHGAGYGWRGVHGKHLFPALNEEQTWDIWLIDCEGVHSRVTHRAARRDIQALLDSFDAASGGDAFRRMVADKMASDRVSVAPRFSGGDAVTMIKER